MKTSRIACLAIVTLLTSGSLVRAESLVHIDELSSTAERQARQVLYQTYHLHAYGPAAQELKAGALQMIRLAQHIHEVAHVNAHAVNHWHRGHRARIDRQAHINSDVAELDRLMHEMQGIVLQMKARTVARRPSHGRHDAGYVGISIGRGFSFSFNSRGAGHYRHGTSYRAPSSLDRLDISLAQLSETVHHLLEDTEVVCIGKRQAIRRQAPSIRG